ncbi:MAG TPA: LLM class flavin-dependent oxidoreductase [Candidatus Binataceae bacterium]|nr:LLM class flavin-dependent oxidoreductase [Candidatus Binataceae bacterium]
MKFGIAFTSYIDNYKEVRELEAMGLDSAWFFDSQMVYSDVYATMALAAANTSRIRLGTATSVARNRIAPVTAHSIATINQLAPGRVALGFATGNTGRRMMGMAPVGIKDFCEEAETIRTLLRGGTARYREGDRESTIKLLHPRDGFVCLDPPVPVLIGAEGPKLQTFAAKNADGIITFAGSSAAFAKAAEHMRSTRRQAGVKGPFEIIAMLGAYVTAPGEAPDSAAAREALGPQILAIMRYMLDTFAGPRETMPEPLASFAAEVARLPKPLNLSLYDRYFIGVPENFRRFVNADTIAAMGVSGPPDKVAAHVKGIFDAGADEVALWPQGNGRSIENLKRYRDTVMRDLGAPKSR